MFNSNKTNTHIENNVRDIIIMSTYKKNYNKKLCRICKLNISKKMLFYSYLKHYLSKSLLNVSDNDNRDILDEKMLNEHKLH